MSHGNRAGFYVNRECLAFFVPSKNEFTNTERIQEGKILLILKKVQHFVGIVLTFRTLRVREKVMSTSKC